MVEAFWWCGVWCKARNPKRVFRASPRSLALAVNCCVHLPPTEPTIISTIVPTTTLQSKKPQNISFCLLRETNQPTTQTQTNNTRTTNTQISIKHHSTPHHSTNKKLVLTWPAPVLGSLRSFMCSLATRTSKSIAWPRFGELSSCACLKICFVYLL